MARPRDDPPRGLLNLHLAEDRVHVARYLPSAPIDSFVEHYWTVRWDLRGRAPFTSQTLPYPSVHLVLERGDWYLTGVPTSRFDRTLSDQGAVFGIKFLPGGLRPLIDGPVSALTDQVRLGRDVVSFATVLSERLRGASWTDAAMLAGVESAVAGRLPEPDPRTAQ